MFMAIYWGVVVLLFSVWLGLAYYKQSAGETSPDGFEALTPFLRSRTSSKADSPLRKSKSGSPGVGNKADFDNDLGPADTLAKNIWSLNLVAALGQAKYPSGRTIHPKLVLLVSLFMATLQVFALFLVVDSVDPSAHPITTVPTTPWKTAQHAWTVNSMKWVMVTFLGMSVVSEAGDAQKVFINALMVERHRLRTSRWHPMMTAGLHYVINIGVVIVGVSVILACQDVPSILYNSLAITFINRFDDTTHEFMEKVFGIDCDFEVRYAVWDEPVWLEVFESFVVLLPCLWAFFLIGRAWCNDEMPSVLLAWLMSAVGNHPGWWPQNGGLSQ